jgi:hypothetical protein
MQPHAGGILCAIVEDTTPGQRLQNVGSTNKTGHRPPGAQRFPKGRDVWSEMVIFLAATGYLPLACFPPSANHVELLSKMGSQGGEVQIEAITGEKREAARNQEVLQGMDDHVRRVLYAGPRWSTGRIFVRGSMANQNQIICVEQRNLVRSSSNWRCGSQRLRKERS